MHPAFVGFLFLLLAIALPVGIIFLIRLLTESERSGFSRNITISTIESLHVSHVVRSPSPKNPVTLLNLDVDGLKLQGITLHGLEDIASGEKVLGAFDHSRKKNLVAWLDPVSNKCFFTDGKTSGRSFMEIAAALLLGIGVAAADWLNGGVKILIIFLLLAAVIGKNWYLSSRREQIKAMILAPDNAKRISEPPCTDVLAD